MEDQILVNAARLTVASNSLEAFWTLSETERLSLLAQWREENTTSTGWWYCPATGNWQPPHAILTKLDANC